MSGLRMARPLFLLVASLLSGCQVASAECETMDAGCSPFWSKALFAHKGRIQTLKYIFTAEASGQNTIHRLNPNGSGFRTMLTVPSPVYHLDVMNGWLYYAQGAALHRASVENPVDTHIVTVPDPINGLRAENQGGRTSVFITEAASGMFHRVDPESGGYETIIPSGMAGAKVGLSDRYYIFSDSGNGIRVLDRHQGGSIVPIDAATATGGVDYNNQDGLVYFYTSAINGIRAIDPAGNLVRNMPTSQCLDMKVDPYGKQVYFADTGGGAIRKINTDGTGEEVVGSVVSPISVALEFQEL